MLEYILNTLLSTTKRIKYLGINLIKEVKDFDPENYETQLKVTEADKKKWKQSSCSWMSTLPKAIYRFNATPINPRETFHRNRTKNAKIYMESQKPKQS